MSKSLSTASAENSNRNGLFERRLFGLGLFSMLARGLGPVCSFASTLILARALGAEAAGYFFVVLTLITALAIIAKLGLGTALQRFVGSAVGRGDQACIVGLYHQSLRLAAGFSLVLGIICFTAAHPISTLLFGDSSQASLLRLMSLLVLPLSLLGIFAAFLKSLARPVWGCFVEAGLTPLLTLLVTLPVILLTSPTIEMLAAVLLLAAFVALVLAQRVLLSYLPRGVTPRGLPLAKLLDSCIPLTGVDLLQNALLWLPLLLLPVLANPGEAGLYNVGHRLAAQLGLILLVFSSITSHRFAAHHQRCENDALADLARASTRLMLLFGLPLAMILVVFGRPILGLFGPEFESAEQSLHILVIGQLFNLLTGPAGYLLAMSGHERLLRTISIATVVFMILLSIGLIPLLGSTGAAIAVTSGMIFQKSL
ncbi:MAG: oligosaccharide flippase family protein, partial [Gammaproteobacteria bacterium]|nr:oligosaccharide flippase family protein [Gammaproteobacteria bacterium]